MRVYSIKVGLHKSETLIIPLCIYTERDTGLTLLVQTSLVKLKAENALQQAVNVVFHKVWQLYNTMSLILWWVGKSYFGSIALKRPQNVLLVALTTTTWTLHCIVFLDILSDYLC